MRGNAPGTRTLEERLARKIVRAKASPFVRDECHLWQGARTSDGYALIKIGGGAAVPTYVHRLVFEQTYGPIPEGKEPDHLCSVRNCVNPAHLEAVTRSENIHRGHLRRRRLAA